MFSLATFSCLGGRNRQNRELDLTKFIIQTSECNEENGGEGGEGGCEEVMIRRDRGIGDGYGGNRGCEGRGNVKSQRFGGWQGQG